MKIILKYCAECGQPIEDNDSWLCEKCKP